MTPTPFYRMSPLEVAVGWVPGVLAPVPKGGRRGPAASPRAAFEAPILAALTRAPCVVAFSGGRDSSAILAVAMDLARRYGLPAPVAVTRLFPNERDSDEEAWQERVIRHLGVDSWVRLVFKDELDVLGPWAVAGLRRHGLLWPPMIHGNQPLLELAAGGCVLTGEGGDEVLGERRVTPLARALRRRRGLDRRAARDGLMALAPRHVQAAVARSELDVRLGLGWLRPPARRVAIARLARDAAGEPLRWSRGIRQVSRRRSLHLGLLNMALVAAESGVDYSHPFLDDDFIGAFSRVGGSMGFAGRTAALQHLFGDLLPDDVLRRRTKATFNAVAVNRHSREFIGQWSGDGVDPDLVDPEALADVWAAPVPHAMSLSLLQSAWLAQRAAA